jgi:hypothetical protein
MHGNMHKTESFIHTCIVLSNVIFICFICIYENKQTDNMSIGEQSASLAN